VRDGEKYDEEAMEIYDDETGDVLICTFPGLARTAQDENGGKFTVRTVKARILLQSAFD
jgi:hypothetical protein